MAGSPDVLVIGGGIVGAASAYQLARRGASVTLLEQDRLASGATGRNLGFIWLHTRRAGPELDLVMATRNELEGLPEELGADFGLRTNGGLFYFNTEAQGAVMREFVERRTADGVPMRLLDGDEARAWRRSCPRRCWAPRTARSTPRSIRPATCARSRPPPSGRAPGSSRARPRAHSRPIGGRITRVETDLGPIAAGHVVLAGGAWSPYLAAQLGIDLPIHPMRLQIVQTEPMPPRLDVVLYGPAAVKQYAIFRELPSYRQEAFATALEDRLGLALLESACQTADGSYLLGIAMDFPGFDWQPDLAGISLVAEGMADRDPRAQGRQVRPSVGRRAAVHLRQPADHRPRARLRRPDHRGRPRVRQRRRPDDRPPRRRPRLRYRAGHRHDAVPADRPTLVPVEPGSAW